MGTSIHASASGAMKWLCSDLWICWEILSRIVQTMSAFKICLDPTRTRRALVDSAWWWWWWSDGSSSPLLYFSSAHRQWDAKATRSRHLWEVATEIHPPRLYIDPLMSGMQLWNTIRPNIVEIFVISNAESYGGDQLLQRIYLLTSPAVYFFYFFVNYGYGCWSSVRTPNVSSSLLSSTHCWFYWYCGVFQYVSFSFINKWCLEVDVNYLAVVDSKWSRYDVIAQLKCTSNRSQHNICVLATLSYLFVLLYFNLVISITSLFVSYFIYNYLSCNHRTSIMSCTMYTISRFHFVQVFNFVHQSAVVLIERHPMTNA